MLIGQSIFNKIRTEFGSKTLIQPGKPTAVITGFSVYWANPETLGFGSYQQSALSSVSIEKKYCRFIILPNHTTTHPTTGF